MQIILHKERDYSWTIKRGTSFGDDIRITLSQNGRDLAQMSCDDDTGRFVTTAEDGLQSLDGETGDLVRLLATAEKGGCALELCACQAGGDESFVVVDHGVIAFEASIVLGKSATHHFVDSERD